MIETRSGSDWWRTAVIYQVYLRSFADGNGDGIGDLPGLRARLPYVAGLGVDAIWITPWYPSPMADGGYDVADYRAIDPLFGTLDDAQTVLDDAHGLGLRVLVDIVPNHTSSEHRWFQAALRASPGSVERGRYHFRDGRGPGGDEPPNDWRSAFGGPAWTRVTETDGAPGQWYLHLFAPEQPDLNWASPEIRADFEQTLRFWFDLGVDGLRIDVAMNLAKDPDLPDLATFDGPPSAGHPYTDRDEVHDVWRSWRRIADGYDPPRVFVGEVHVGDPARLAAYARPDELHTVFNFEFLKAPFEAGSLRAAVDRTLGALGAVGAPSTWVLSNHDEPRHLTRFGLPYTWYRPPDLPDEGEPDLALGTRRARAAVLLSLALPGGAYLYQGEELGLWEVRDLPAELRQDPAWARSGGTVQGRDGCRVPLPWAGQAPPFAFGAGELPWLPQPDAWRDHTVEAEDRDPGSMLTLYREALRLRRETAALVGAPFEWLPAPADALVFSRGAAFRCALNLGAAPLSLPADRRTLVRSDGGSGDLPPDVAEWFEVTAR